uniref:AraA protein n=1 Tax=Fopius arisanus TaxID=64838 RepID=A0A0C9QK75_9HYME
MSEEKFASIKAKRLKDVFRDETDIIQTEWMIDYTVTNILKKIKLNDNTVEIIDWAESLGPLEQTGLHEFVFQCILKNDENQKIKFIAFNDDARRLYPFFRQDYVIMNNSS